MKLIPTLDGSLTLFDLQSKQHYHNKAGAFIEAMENYVLPTQQLAYNKGNPVIVLDACYGLGYNSWALLQHILSQSPPCEVYIHLIELNSSLFSLTSKLLKQEHYRFLRSQFSAPCWLACEAFFLRLGHTQVPKNNLKAVSMAPPIFSDASIDTPETFSMESLSGHQIHWHCHLADLRQVLQKPPENLSKQLGQIDLIFHDPFSPAQMPELWSVDLFSAYFSCLKLNGQVLTYSLAGAVRGALLEAGFVLMKSPGVGNKPGGTVAFKSVVNDSNFTQDLLPAFSEVEQRYVQSRSGIPYRDPQLNSTRDEIRQAREAEQAASPRESASTFRQTAF